MNHLTDLQCSMYADAALLEAEAADIEQHVAGCEACAAQLAVFRTEKQLIMNVLGVEDVVSIPAAPKFSHAVSLKTFAIANVATGLVIWFAGFLWKTLFGELVVNAFSWATSIAVPDASEIAISTVLYLSQDGATMFETLLGLVAIGLVALALTWAAFSYRKARVTLGVGLLTLTAAGLITPAPVQALDFRHNEEMISLPAGETVDDTLIIAGETVVIDGDVTGDLLAFGNRVLINGSVGGNLITAAETVTINGNVGGTTISAGSTVEFRETKIGGDLWSAGSSVTIGAETRVNRNAAIAGEMCVIDGSVQRDLFAFAENIELSGNVGEDLEAGAERLSLLGNASVGGNVRFHSDDEDDLLRSSGVTIGGEIEVMGSTHEITVEGSEYTRGGYYAGQLVRLVAAFIAGIVLLWLIPRFRDVTLSGGVAGLATAGIGLVSIISLPIIMVLLAITVVGLPLTFTLLFAWLFIIYFAKIIVAVLLGRMFLANTNWWDSTPLTLIAGLAAVILAINIPALGGIFSFVLTIVGAGLIVQLILGYTSDLSSSEA